MDLKLSAADLTDFVDSVFEQVRGDYVIEDLMPGSVRVRMNVQDKHLRPGGTVSGPSMFSLADLAAYYVTMAHVGAEALAVTTNCSIDFMRKPMAGSDLVAEARLLKLGRTLSVTDVLIYSEGMEAPVARASLTYSIPPWAK